MPSSSTITAFYNFTANSRARASQVQNNFDVIRGNFIPIHPSTATSSDNAYNLGSNDYRWANVYSQIYNFGNTTTNNAAINIDTATSTGELVFKVNGTEKARINASGIKATNAYNFDLTATANQGGLAASAGFTVQMSVASSALITGSTCTLATNGRPIHAFLLPAAYTTSAYLQLSAQTQAAYDIQALISLYMDNSLVSQSPFQLKTQQATTTALNAGGNPSIILPYGAFNYFYPAAAGSHTFDLRATVVAGDGTLLTLSNLKLAVKEH